MNTEREQIGRTSSRKGEGDKLETGKTIKMWEDGKVEEKKDVTGRRPQNKRSGESTTKEDCMEVKKITNDNSTTKEAEYKTPVMDRMDQGKTARDEEVEMEEGIIALTKTSLQTKSPQQNLRAKQAPRKPPLQVW